MVAPFNQAWMLLKQRGHELNLPPPRIMGDNPARSLSPQDLTDRRVNRASALHHTLDDFEGMAFQKPRIRNLKDADRYLEYNEGTQRALANALEDAQRQQAEESHFERLQGDLDRQTLARMGQQPEADEMDAMGIPEMDETGMPMSRTLSATPPPNVGMAGSSGRPPVGSDDLSNELSSTDPDFHESYVRQLNQLGPLENPFTQKPAVQEDAENRLMNWAEGAGRKEGAKNSMPDKLYPEELIDPPIEGFHNSPAPAGESAPTQMDIPNTVSTSPRMSRRNRPGESAPYFKKPDREEPIGMSPSRRAMNLLQRNTAD